MHSHLNCDVQKQDRCSLKLLGLCLSSYEGNCYTYTRTHTPASCRALILKGPSKGELTRSLESVQIHMYAFFTIFQSLPIPWEFDFQQPPCV